MALIDIKKMSFRYGADYVFKDVDLQIDSNWKLGLIGRNGRGKTTLLKILMGQLEYDGKILAQENFLYFPMHVTNPECLTIQVIEDVNPDYEYWRVQKECQLLQVDEDVLYRPFNTLSNGEQTKILLLLLFLREDAFILIDEPTNHLDLQGRQVVSAYLQKKKGFILVSHDRQFIDGCVDHILAINKSTIDLQVGNFSSWYENKERLNAYEIDNNKKIEKEIQALEAATKRTKRWSEKVESTKRGTRISGLRPDTGFIGHRSAKMMQKAKNTERRLQQSAEEKKNLLKDIEEVDDLHLPAIRYKKKQLMRLENISIFYDQKQVCKNVSFTINQGDKIAITGKNGSGKTSLLKLLMKRSLTYQGTLIANDDIIISYVKQSITTVQGDLTAYIHRCEVDETMVKTLLRKMDFTRYLFTVPMERYSDGQKKKVLLACALSKPAHLYVFDEPLNYIDVFSRIQIENMIKQSDATLVFVEHDDTFVKNITTKEVHL